MSDRVPDAISRRIDGWSHVDDSFGPGGKFAEVFVLNECERLAAKDVEGADVRAFSMEEEVGDGSIHGFVGGHV